MAVSRLEVVAAAAVKKFKKMVEGYRGPERELRGYLLRELERMEAKGDQLLADIIDQILL
jgi:triphosphoribosyl-dephospho-CoA synthetase